MNVVGNLSKASETGTLLGDPPDDNLVLVVDPATNQINRTRVDSLTASTSSGGGGGGGLASVATDATLSGDGTAGDALSVANPFTDADETKLDGIEMGAQRNVGVEYTQAEKTKLLGIEDGAKDDQSGTEIISAIDSEIGTDWKTGGGGGGGTQRTFAEIRDGLEGLVDGEQLSYNALDDQPITITKSETSRIDQLWQNSPHTSAIIWHGSFLTGHFASTWRGYNRHNTGDPLSSAGQLGSVVNNPALDLTKIITMPTGSDTDAVVTTIIEGGGNRTLYFGTASPVLPASLGSSAFITGVRLAIEYAGTKVFDRPLTDFSVSDQSTIRLQENDLLPNQFRTRADNSRFDVFLYKAGDNSELTLDTLASGNIQPANKDTTSMPPSSTQGLVESTLTSLIDAKIAAAGTGSGGGGGVSAVETLLDRKVSYANGVAVPNFATLQELSSDWQLSREIVSADDDKFLIFSFFLDDISQFPGGFWWGDVFVKASEWRTAARVTTTTNTSSSSLVFGFEGLTHSSGTAVGFGFTKGSNTRRIAVGDNSNQIFRLTGIRVYLVTFGGSGSNITVDSIISDGQTNPVQGNAIHDALVLKANQTALAALTTRVTSAENINTQQTTSISTNATNISNKADQSALDATNSNLTTLTGRVSTNETNIASNTTAIGTKANISSLQTTNQNVATNTTNIALKLTTPTNNSGGSVGQVIKRTADGYEWADDNEGTGGGSPITIDSAITDGSTNPVQNNAIFDALALKANQTALTALTGRVTANEATNTTQNTDISNLNSNFFALRTRVSTNETKNTEQDTAIGTKFTTPTGTPTANQIIKFDGTDWVFADDEQGSGGGGGVSAVETLLDYTATQTSEIQSIGAAHTWRSYGSNYQFNRELTVDDDDKFLFFVFTIQNPNSTIDATGNGAESGQTSFFTKASTWRNSPNIADGTNFADANPLSQTNAYFNEVSILEAGRERFYKIGRSGSRQIGGSRNAEATNRPTSMKVYLVTFGGSGSGGSGGSNDSKVFLGSTCSGTTAPYAEVDVRWLLNKDDDTLKLFTRPRGSGDYEEQATLAVSSHT